MSMIEIHDKLFLHDIANLVNYSDGICANAVKNGKSHSIYQTVCLYVFPIYIQIHRFFSHYADKVISDDERKKTSFA